MTDQFPALNDEPETEVAQRSPDGSDGLVHKKIIRGQISLEVAQNPESPVHHDNKLAVLQEALQRGLHPKEEPVLESAEVFCVNRRGVETVDMTYAVECEPASVDPGHPETTVEPAELLDELGGTTRPDEDPTVEGNEESLARSIKRSLKKDAADNKREEV